MANVVVDTAPAIVTNLVSGLGGTVPKFMGIGTGAGTSAHTDSALFTEPASGSTVWTPAYARTANAPTRTTTAVANDTMSVTGTFTVAAAQATQGVTNAGLFDSLQGGTNALFIKGDFAVINLGPGDSIALTATWQAQHS